MMPSWACSQWGNYEHDWLDCPECNETYEKYLEDTMTVKVIDEGPDPSVIKRITCKSCGAKLEYVPNDVQSRSYSDYDGYSGSTDFITCPKCKKEVTIKSW